MLFMFVSYVHIRICEVEWTYSRPKQFYVQFSNRKQWTPQVNSNDTFLMITKK